MCYDISTGLFDTNIRRLYMYDKPGRLCRPPHKSRNGRLHSFHERKHFFVRFSCWPLAGQLAGWHMDSCIKIRHIYICEY